MLRWITSTSLQFRYLIIVVAAVLVAVGLTQLGNMPVDVLPEFSPPYVEIQTEALGLSAEEVEQMITVPMEQDLLAGVAWADVIRSESVPGLSSVIILFEPGTDLFRARQMVSERLSQAAVGLPHVSKPPAMIQPLSSSSRFMIVGLSSKDLSLIEMSVLARWVIGPRLLGVPGVANVATWGNRDRQLQVLVDPERLRAQGVSLQQIVETTGNALWVSSLSYLEASSPGTGGFIDTPNQRLGVWHVLPISSPEELAQIPVEGTSLILSDVAQVVEDHQPLIGDAIINDGPNLLLVIEKLPGTNTLDVTRGVEEALDALRPGMAGIEFNTTLFRPATFIEMAMSNLTRTLIIGAVLAALVLGLFFYGWRTALISLIVIPLSLVAALLVLYVQGATFNTIVLAGLVVALGIVVDDAVVDVEHILRQLRQPRSEASALSPLSIIMEASAETRSTLFFVTLMMLLAVTPVFFMEGESGALFRPLVIAYILAVLTSLLVALTVTPALSLILLAGTSNTFGSFKESPLAVWLQGGYERTLAGIVQKPGLAYATMTVLVMAGLVAVPFISPKQLLPAFTEPYILIQLNGAPGASHTAMSRIVTRATTELRTIPGVKNVGAHVGRAVLGDQVVGINSAQLWVEVDPQANYDATVAAIQETVDGYAGFDQKVKTYLQQALNLKPAAPADSLTVRVFGESHEVLQSEAERVRQTLAGIQGVATSEVALPPNEPTLEIEVDLAAAQTHGIKPGDVRRAAAILLSGLQVGSLFEEQKVFDVVVWGTPDMRQSLTNIRELLIEAPTGYVRLGDVADVRIVAAPNIIRREAISPYLDINLTVQGRTARAVMGDIQSTLKTLTFPLEYHAVVLNENATQQATQQRLLLAALVAVIGIFLLLQASLDSWRMAGVVFVGLLAALAGGTLAMLVSGSSSLSSTFGLLAVLGIAARQGVLLISHCQRLEQAGEAFGPALILRGAREQLPPILMTTLVTGLGLLPFVILGNIPGHEMARPIVIILLGGLAASALVNLFILPTLYLRFGAKPLSATARASVGAQAGLTASAD